MSMGGGGGMSLSRGAVLRPPLQSQPMDQPLPGLCIMAGVCVLWQEFVSFSLDVRAHRCCDSDRIVVEEKRPLV